MRSYQYSVVKLQIQLITCIFWFTSMLDNLVVFGQLVHICVTTCKHQILIHLSLLQQVIWWIGS